jgi:archaeosine-15-forming tRNA-guanine transglycosylase
MCFNSSHLLFLYAFQIRTVVSQDDEIYCSTRKMDKILLDIIEGCGTTIIMHTANPEEKVVFQKS